MNFVLSGRLGGQHHSIPDEKFDSEEKALERVAALYDQYDQKIALFLSIEGGPQIKSQTELFAWYGKLRGLPGFSN
jgi:hypothetical protein